MIDRPQRVTRSARLLAFLGLLAFACETSAVEGGFNVRWGYDFGYGSPKLVETSQLGFPNDRRSITASEGEFYAVGLSLMDDSHAFMLDAALGIKSATLCDFYTINTWGDVLWPTCPPEATLNVEFARIPLELIAAYEGIPYLRLGAGLTYQIGPELTVYSPVANYHVWFDNALGYVAEIALRGEPRNGYSALIGARYTWLRYERHGVEIANANGFGLFVGMTLR